MKMFGSRIQGTDDRTHLDASLKQKVPFLERIRKAEFTFLLAKSLAAFSLTGTAATILTTPGCTQQSPLEIQKERVQDQLGEVLLRFGISSDDVTSIRMGMLEYGLWMVEFELKDGSTAVFEGRLVANAINWVMITQELKDWMSLEIKEGIPAVLGQLGIEPKNVLGVVMQYASHEKWIVAFTFVDGSALNFEVFFKNDHIEWRADCDCRPEIRQELRKAPVS